MPSREALRAISKTVHAVSALAIAGGATKIGTTIPTGMRRYISMIRATPRSGTAQDLQISSCAAAGAVETNIEDRFRLPTSANNAPTVIGGDIESPVLIIQEDATHQDIGISHQTDAIDVTISYYDLPI